MLRWVADGCPTDPEVPHTYKTTARSLAGHDLVKVKGSGKSWKATITDRGSRVLAGKEPLRKPKRKRGSTYVPPPVSRPVPMTATEQEINELAETLAAELNASDDGWTTRRVTEQYRKDVLFPATALLRGPKKHLLNRDLKVVAKCEFYYREPKLACVFYVEPDTWLTGDPAPLVSGEKKIGKYHPGVAQVMQVTLSSLRWSLQLPTPGYHSLLSQVAGCR